MSKIERRGFWLMWGGLLAAMVIQHADGQCRESDRRMGRFYGRMWLHRVQSASGMACGTAIFLPVWEPMRFVLCWRPWRLRCYVA